MNSYIKSSLDIELHCDSCLKLFQLGHLFLSDVKPELVCSSCQKGRNIQKNPLAHLPQIISDILLVFDPATANIATQLITISDRLYQTCKTYIDLTRSKLSQFEDTVSKICLSTTLQAKKFIQQQNYCQELIEKLNDRLLNASDLRSFMRKQHINLKKYTANMLRNQNKMKRVSKRISEFQVVLPQLRDLLETDTQAVCVTPIQCFAAQNDKVIASTTKGTLGCLTQSSVFTHQAHQDQIRAVSWYNDMLISVGDDGFIRYWKIEEQFKMVKEFQTTHSLTKTYSRNMVCLDHYGLIVTCTGQNQKFKLYCWSYDNGCLLYELSGHEDYIKAMIPISGSTYLLTASSDMTIRLWDVVDRKCTMVIHVYKKIFNMVYCDKYQLVIVLEEDSTISLYPICNNRKLHCWKEPKSVFSMCLVGQDNIAVSNNMEIQIKTIWGDIVQRIDIDTKRKVLLMYCHNNVLYCSEGTGKVKVYNLGDE